MKWIVSKVFMYVPFKFRSIGAHVTIATIHTRTTTKDTI